jgi:hypothetical protein
MNTEIRIKLLDLVKEYGDSLLRMDAEKDIQKAMAERAELECQVKPAHFKKSALAYYKDKVKITRDDLEEQLDLLDVIRGDSND